MISNALEKDFEIVGMVSDGRTLVARAKALSPDLIISSVSLPALSGVEAWTEIRRTNPLGKIIFLSIHIDEAYVSAAFHVGASGYVLKTDALSELPTAIRFVLEGKRYISPSLPAQS
jgi:DNA-binding NarL/FixJ family response regulator